MIKETSDFFQNPNFFPILNIYNSPDDQCVQICVYSKYDAILQPVIESPARDWTEEKGKVEEEKKKKKKKKIFRRRRMRRWWWRWKGQKRKRIRLFFVPGERNAN